MKEIRLARRKTSFDTSTIRQLRSVTMIDRDYYMRQIESLRRSFDDLDGETNLTADDIVRLIRGMMDGRRAGNIRRVTAEALGDVICVPDLPAPAEALRTDEWVDFLRMFFRIFPGRLPAFIEQFQLRLLAEPDTSVGLLTKYIFLLMRVDAEADE